MTLRCEVQPAVRRFGIGAWIVVCTVMLSAMLACVQCAQQARSRLDAAAARDPLPGRHR